MLQLFLKTSSLWLVLALAGLLTACGGGGGGGGDGAGGGGGVAGGGGGIGADSAAPAPDNSSVPTVLASVYVGTSGSSGFWAVTQSTQAAREFLAMNYNGNASSSVSTTLYSGSLLAGVNGSARSSGLRTMRANGSVRDGEVSFSEVSLVGLKASFDASISAEAADYQAQAVTPVDAVAGNWSGRWVDGVNSNASLSLSGLVAGGTVSVNVGNCSVQVTVAAWQPASGLYAVQVGYPGNQTLCPRQGTALKGWAFVQQMPDKKRLQFMAVDASGSGISFRAER